MDKAITTSEKRYRSYRKMSETILPRIEFAIQNMGDSEKAQSFYDEVAYILQEGTLEQLVALSNSLKNVGIKSKDIK